MTFKTLSNIKKWAMFVLQKRSVPVDVQDLLYWFCALCGHRRETIMLESDQLEKTEPFQQ
jgi:hypothetical protein